MYCFHCLPTICYLNCFISPILKNTKKSETAQNYFKNCYINQTVQKFLYLSNFYKILISTHFSIWNIERRCKFHFLLLLTYTNSTNLFDAMLLAVILHLFFRCLALLVCVLPSHKFDMFLDHNKQNDNCQY